MRECRTEKTENDPASRESREKSGEAFSYEGEELALFRLAHHWKAYWGQQVTPHIQGDVLEVGAGLGENAARLVNPRVKTWLCLEPDQKMAAMIKARVDSGALNAGTQVVCGTLVDLPPEPQFDTIVYIDVLEHVSDDAEEIRQACLRMKAGASLVLLSPAHGFLFSNFDAAIGHFRRYDRKSLQSVVPGPLKQEKLIYLDSVGMLLSMANRVLLKQSHPTAQQILFWDKVIVPLSRVVDPLLFHRLGKSVLGVWSLPDRHAT